ncbi:LuxR C-terminal-related transcriptional regulator [Fangia hongkongensis]|uniref:LuxR C-terminal-related transcriptional regulator n=1 Tax=Fangia hongkongensis TaxID=270495 RepID=UPI00035DF586|nr:LuxR C-terminal-related transcriptional regulator [Fangia hongkongensis]MBK2124876.1 hypothetical protein [Fangia hongkongensis]
MDEFSPKKPITLFQSEGKSTLHEVTDQLLLNCDEIYNNTQFIDSISDLIVIKDVNSRLTKCNRALSVSAGLDSPDDIFMKTDFDMIWNEGNLAPSFLQKDRLINQGVTQLNLGRYKYSSGLKTVMIKRFPIYKNGIIVGNITILTEIKNFSMKEICDQAYLFGVNISDQQVLEEIENQFVENSPIDKYELSEKEIEVLYWSVRGKSAREIAELACKSYYTVYDTQERIKKKMGVKLMSDVKDIAFDTGIINELLKRNF